MSVADDIAFVLSRAGFGPTPAEVVAARQSGYEATVTALTSPPGPDLGASNAPVPDIGPDPAPRLGDLTPAERAVVDQGRGVQLRTLSRWWLDRLSVADHQATEKLLFFWHGHWATSVKKVLRPQLMLAQHLTLRSTFDFSAMANRMIADPALIFWLDGELNTRAAPNENLARELMELFTLGIGNYTEQDVKEAGRALTGWRIDYNGARAYPSQAFHDPGTKTILGVSQRFDAPGLISLLLRQEQCPRFIAARLWYRYGSSVDPVPASTQAKMVAAFPDTLAMLRALLLDDAFRASAGRQVKQPIEWFVGAMRQLSLRPAALPDAALAEVLDGLELMGQLPFAPPSVGGWPAGAAWLTAGAAQARIAVAAAIAPFTGAGSVTVDELATLLAVGRWSDRTKAALSAVPDPRHRLVIALASPEYLVT
jgi:uncharacterized protein (DUF1800 family)